MSEGKQLYNLNKNWLGYDLDNFSGRVQHWFRVLDPRNGNYSNETLYAYKKDLDSYMARADADGFAELTPEEFKDFQHKKMILSTCLHPDTQEPIMWLARSSTFVQSNILILSGMLLSAPTPMNTIFWQWINQTYNACLNFGNRNASSETSTQQMVQSYFIAVGSSISAALLFRKILMPLGEGRSPFIQNLLRYATPWGAVALAGFCNFYSTRKGELVTGIQVKDTAGEVYGLS